MERFVGKTYSPESGLDVYLSAIALRLIDSARRAISENPHDLAHNWENHHQPCLENLKEIIEKDKLCGKVDVYATSVAVAWHDYKRGKKDYSKLREEGELIGAPSEFIDKVIGIIQEHSFGNRQSSLESDLVYLSDKIEYVSLDRYLISKNMPRLPVFLYKLTWRNRINKVINEISSKGSQTAMDIFRRKFERLVEYVEEHDQKDLIFFKGVDFVV